LQRPIADADIRHLMITFPLILGPDGRPLVRQELTRPSVFLDTWALRLFAEDDLALGERFQKALMTAGGSLVLTDLSLIEFTFDDPRNAANVGRYVDQLGPDTETAKRNNSIKSLLIAIASQHLKRTARFFNSVT
jgi:hypothetical protein